MQLPFEFESLSAPNCATWVLVATAELPNPLLDTRYSDYYTVTLAHDPPKHHLVSFNRGLHTCAQFSQNIEECSDPCVTDRF